MVCPSNPNDGFGLLKSSIKDNNCIIFLESEMMYGVKGEVDDSDDFYIPLSSARIDHIGSDVTLVSWGKSLWEYLKYHHQLQQELDISIEVIDLRTLQPYDQDCIYRSIEKTHRLIIVEEGWGFGSVGSEIISDVVANRFDELDAPCVKVSSDFVPIPYNPKLESHVLPNKQKVYHALLQLIS